MLRGGLQVRAPREGHHAGLPGRHHHILGGTGESRTVGCPADLELFPDTVRRIPHPHPGPGFFPVGQSGRIGRELQPGVVQLYVPMTFMISPAGQAAQPTRFLMNQVVVKTADGWKVSSILPIPAPQPEAILLSGWALTRDVAAGKSY